MYSPEDQLRDQLYQRYLGINAKASTGMEDMAPTIDMLTEVMRGFGEALYTRPEMLAFFKAHVPDFDVDNWLHKQVEAGHYDDSVFDDNPTYID